MRTRLFTARDERDQGFTLIELLVVVIIIGILAAIAIPVFLNQRKKGVDAGIKSDLKNAAIAVETWITDHPSEPVPSQNYINGTTAVTGVTATATPDIAFRPSPGNTIAVRPSATVGAYCVFGSNAGASTAIGGASDAAAVSIAYNSQTGGLQTTPATVTGWTCA